MTALILGAGLMQGPAIECAKNLGYYTVVVDGNPNAICADKGDRFEPVDLKDKEGLLNLAKSLDDVKVVFTAGTDFSASVAYVSNALGLHGHKYEACLNASNKIRMRECFEKGNAASPDFIQITASDISLYDDEKLAAMKFPKVVKPVDNMGARGCRMIRNAQEFKFSVEDAVRNSRSGCAILEDYMDGPEFSIDSLVYNGTLTITGFADRHIYYPPYFIETGHTMPTQISEKQKKELIAAFAKGVKALGLTEGAAKGDIKYTKDGPMIGEIAARLSGGYMSGWTYPYASDINLTKQGFLIASGEKPVELLEKRVVINDINDSPFELFEVPCVRTCVERAWISIPGKVASITGYEKAEKVCGVKDVLPRSVVGDDVDFPRNNVQKCGNIIAIGNSFEEAQNAAYEAIKNITVRLEPNNVRTDEFLAGKELLEEKGFPPVAYPQAYDKVLCDGGFDKVFSGMIEKACEYNCPKWYSLSSEEDWNHSTISETLKRFDSICPNHKKIDSARFFEALLKGGIQGVLYIVDSLSGQEK